MGIDFTQPKSVCNHYTKPLRQIQDKENTELIKHNGTTGNKVLLCMCQVAKYALLRRGS